MRPVDFYEVRVHEDVLLPESLVHWAPIVAFDAIKLRREGLDVAVVTQLPTGLNLKLNCRELKDYG